MFRLVAAGERYPISKIGFLLKLSLGRSGPVRNVVDSYSARDFF